MPLKLLEQQISEHPVAQLVRGQYLDSPKGGDNHRGGELLELGNATLVVAR